MNTVLLALAVLSVGAVVVAAYVFTVAARNYVSDAPSAPQVSGDSSDEKVGSEYISRTTKDRREISNVIAFPVTLSSGEVVYHDRRASERRTAG